MMWLRFYLARMHTQENNNNKKSVIVPTICGKSMQFALDYRNWKGKGRTNEKDWRRVMGHYFKSEV